MPFAAGQVVTADEINELLPQAVVNELGADATATTSEATILSVTFNVAAGQKITIAADIQLNANGANRICTLRLKENGATIRTSAYNSGADSLSYHHSWNIVRTPSPGAVTYAVTAQTSTFTAAIPAGAQLRVEPTG